jgi:acyl-CoA dehydrogenase
MTYNWDTGSPSIETAIAAKTFCTQKAFEVANRAVQIFGADGFSRGNLIEKLFRDARVSLVEQGVNEALDIAGALRLIQ